MIGGSSYFYWALVYINIFVTYISTKAHYTASDPNIAVILVQFTFSVFVSSSVNRSYKSKQKHNSSKFVGVPRLVTDDLVTLRKHAPTPTYSQSLLVILYMAEAQL